MVNGVDDLSEVFLQIIEVSDSQAVQEVLSLSKDDRFLLLEHHIVFAFLNSDLDSEGQVDCDGQGNESHA
eukprot:CAMPEP_0170511378 /NCGR_PEP_ID=MMETSP0208-20121228/66272_1 /TAXON_ID=197538 /ORGANISM="Strombidium inclinatum, Strain S3" /LENGTH=69 /DNA_ID=CAMNT_0010794915 /DNA_START=759 /DNA_END=968 /DNA_ORIENTATION=+